MLKIQKASAGSGKTFALTRSYIKLLLGEKQPGGGYRLATAANRHRAILAITFTNKATEEMKDRIIKHLALLADPQGSIPYRHELCQELCCTPERLARQAAKALDELLADFGSFNISTIDAFFQTVLRTFAREANLSGNYEVQLDATRAVLLGVNAMLASLNATPADDATPADARRRRQLMVWLRQYMMQMLNDGKAFNLFVRNSHVAAAIVKYINDALNETYKLNAEAINGYLQEPERVERFAAALAAAYRRRHSQLQQMAKATLSMIEAAGATQRLNQHVLNHFTKWSNGDINVKKELIDSILKIIDDPRSAFKKQYKHPEPALTEAAGSLAATAGNYWADMNALRLLRDNIFHLGIIGEVERRIAEVQRENNAILLSDTNTILQAIINQEEAPFIYERLGLRLRHFLIDEFQDTSRLQWLNISPLVRESLATGNDNLIIGDEKQAIYRFRNSDPTLITTDVPKEFASQAELHGTTVQDNTNWRSSRQVVQFNNTLFLALAEQLHVRDVYDNVVQNIKHTGLEGYVELTPYASASESLDRMVVHIRRQLASGYRQRDIAVLCSRNGDCRDVVARLLDEKASDMGLTPAGPLAAMRVITDEALVVAKAQSVGLIVGVLRYIDSHVGVSHQRGASADATLAEAVSRYEYFRAMGREASEALALAFSNEQGAVADQTALQASEMECVNVPSIVERIVARCIAPGMRRDENLYISAFQDMVVDFCANGNADLHSFLKWWDETGSEKSLAVPEGIDGIRVMTIHKSKGLEFACVHVPLLSGEFNNPRSIMWTATHGANGEMLPLFQSEEFDAADVPPLIPLQSDIVVSKVAHFTEQYVKVVVDERIDVLNKIYVAFTRAARELIVSYRAKRKGVKNSVGMGVGEELMTAFATLTPERCAELAQERELPDGLLIALSDKLHEEVLPPAAGDEGEGEASGDAGEEVTVDVLTIGAPTRPPQAAKRELPEAMPDYYSYDNDNIWAMSRVEDLEELQRPRQRGIVLHAIMGHVGRAADVGRAVMRAHMRGLLPAAEVEATTAQLRQALADERVARWFTGYRRLLRERTITVRRGEAMHYRPDRVVWTADGTIEVVDYKFGEEEPQRYQRQVAGYVALLRRAYPGATVRGYLWYPLSGAIVEVAAEARS